MPDALDAGRGTGDARLVGFGSAETRRRVFVMELSSSTNLECRLPGQIPHHVPFGAPAAEVLG